MNTYTNSRHRAPSSVLVVFQTLFLWLIVICSSCVHSTSDLSGIKDKTDSYMTKFEKMDFLPTFQANGFGYQMGAGRTEAPPPTSPPESGAGGGVAGSSAAAASASGAGVGASPPSRRGGSLFPSWNWPECTNSGSATWTNSFRTNLVLNCNKFILFLCPVSPRALPYYQNDRQILHWLLLLPEDTSLSRCWIHDAPSRAFPLLCKISIIGECAYDSKSGWTMGVS